MQLYKNNILHYIVVLFFYSYGVEATLGFKTPDSRLNIKEGGRPEMVCVGFEDRLGNNDTITVSLSLEPVESQSNRLQKCITLYTY